MAGWQGGSRFGCMPGAAGRPGMCGKLGQVQQGAHMRSCYRKAHAQLLQERQQESTRAVATGKATGKGAREGEAHSPTAR